MNILLTSNSCWNLYNFRKELINSLKNNNKIIIAAPYDNYKSKIIFDEIIYVPLHIKQNRKSIFSDIICLFQYLYIIFKYKPIYALAFTIKPNIYCSLASLFFKTKMINNITGLGSTIIRDNFFTKIIYFSYKIIFKNSYKVVFQNKEDRKIFINKKISNHNNSVLIPGSGINLQEYNHTVSSDYHKFTFLFIGRLIKDKGICEFIEAAEIVKKKSDKKIEFNVLGSYDNNNPNKIEYNYFKSFIDKKIINYLGFSSNPISVIARSTCVVLPSYREGLSRSLLESMALGKPILTSNVPGCNDLVIENSNGFLCKVKNKVDLAEKMLTISNLDYSKIEQMGQNGRDIIKKYYTNEIVIDKFLKLII